MVTDRQGCVQQTLYEGRFRLRPQGFPIYKEKTLGTTVGAISVRYSMTCIKPATHQISAILYADRGDRRIKSPISGMSDIGD